MGRRPHASRPGVHHKILVACAVEVRRRAPGTAQDMRKDGRYAGRVRLAVAPTEAQSRFAASSRAQWRTGR